MQSTHRSPKTIFALITHRYEVVVIVIRKSALAFIYITLVILFLLCISELHRGDITITRKPVIYGRYCLVRRHGVALRRQPGKLFIDCYFASSSTCWWVLGLVFIDYLKDLISAWIF